MSNTLTPILQTVIMPMSMEVLRENAVMAGLVYRDFKNEISAHNKQIDVPLPPDMGTASDMDTTNGSTPHDLVSTTVSVTMENWKEKTFVLTDKELNESIITGVLPGAMDGAIKVLANNVDVALWELYKEVQYGYGTPGTTPDADADIIGVRKILQTNLAPRGDRHLVMDVEAEAKFLDLYNKVNETGSTSALREASLGRLYGFDNYADQNITVHTAGVLVPQTAIAAKAIYAIGVSTVVLDDSGAGTLTGGVNKGDRITFAGDTTVYRVTADATAATGEITVIIDPPLVAATTDGMVVTQAGDYTANLAFNRNAMTLAVRPLNELGTFETGASTISTAMDPLTGITMTLEIWREPSKASNFMRYSILYGVKLLREELAAILYG